MKQLINLELSKDFIRETSAKNKEPQWMLDKRLESLELYKQQDMPPMKYGIGIRSSLQDVALVDFETLQQPTVQREGTAEGVLFMSMQEALEQHPELIQKHFMQICKASDNKLAALHAALWNTGTFVYIPANTTADVPLTIQSNMESNSQLQHTLIVAEPHSNITIIEHNTSQETNGFHSHVVEIIAQDSAIVTYGSIQNLGNNVYHFTTKQANVAQSATVNWVDCTFGSAFTKSDLVTNLNGEGAQTNNKACFFGEHTQKFDIAATTKHNADHTTCNMLMKGALNNKAKTIYRGLIKIKEGVKETIGHLNEATILLSPDAEMDPIPSLEIDSNDVTCSHATSVGYVDEDKLFYLMSRGLTEEQATRAIVEGFFEPMLQLLPIQTMQTTIKQDIIRRLEQ